MSSVFSLKFFLKAMDMEIFRHEQAQHWEVVPHTLVPKGTRFLDAVWALHRK